MRLGFTSLHGKWFVIQGSNAGNAWHLYLSLCYEVCCATLNCKMTPLLSFDVFLLCDCLPCTRHSLGLVQSWMSHYFYYHLLLWITRFWIFAYMTDYEELKIITFNTNGLSDFRKRKMFLIFLGNKKVIFSYYIECRKYCEITVGLWMCWCRAWLWQ